MNKRNVKDWKIVKRAILCMLLTVALAGTAAAQNCDPEKIQPTRLSMDFFGYIDGAVPGDRITATDPDGVICGEFTVNREGQYGFMHVYGDDPQTREDEGALPGDRIGFLINGTLLIPGSASAPQWIGDRERLRMDFTIP